MGKTDSRINFISSVLIVLIVDVQIEAADILIEKARKV